MQVLYNFGICLFSILLRIFSPFHAKARMGVLGRKNWKSKVAEIPKNKKALVTRTRAFLFFSGGVRLDHERVRELFPQP